MGADNTFGEENFNPTKLKKRYVIMWSITGRALIFYKPDLFDIRCEHQIVKLYSNYFQKAN